MVARYPMIEQLFETLHGTLRSLFSYACCSSSSSSSGGGWTPDAAVAAAPAPLANPKQRQRSTIAGDLAIVLTQHFRSHTWRFSHSFRFLLCIAAGAAAAAAVAPEAAAEADQVVAAPPPHRPDTSRWSGAAIREAFLAFYEQRGHVRLPSASLVPDDPSVMLTIAGMLQFKPIFLGKVRLAVDLARESFEREIRDTARVPDGHANDWILSHQKGKKDTKSLNSLRWDCWHAAVPNCRPRQTSMVLSKYIRRW